MRTYTGKRKPRKPSKGYHHDVLLPKLGYTHAAGTWLVSDGTVYRLGEAPSEVFRAFVKASLPQSSPVRSECLALVKSTDIDLPTRWFVVCSLLDEKIPIPLYLSQEEALHAQQKGVTHGELFSTYPQ